MAMDIKILHKLLFNFNTSNILEKNDLKITLFVVIDKTSVTEMN